MAKMLRSAGAGGVSGKLVLCYGLSSSWELSAAGGYQESALYPKVENAEGSFSRIILLTTLKYHIPWTLSGTLKIGGGVGYYSPGDLDIDLSNVSGGAHNIFSYESNIGFHLTCDYELESTSRFSWGLGLKYYNTSYNLQSAKSNGVSVPINFLPQELKDETMKLDGNGIDLTIFVVVLL